MEKNKTINPKTERSRLDIKQDGAEVLIDIHKKQDKNQLIGFSVVILILAGFNILLHWLEGTGDFENPDNIMIFHIIFKGFGGIMVVGGLTTFLRKEYIRITRSHLVLGSRFLGIRTQGNHYEWQEIKGLKRAPEPERKWKKVREYDGGGHKNTQYTYDNRIVYPTLQFFHNDREVLFANGLSNSDISLLLSTLGNSGYLK